MNVCFFIAEMTGFGGTERAACSIASGIVGMHGINRVHMVALMGGTTSRFHLDPHIDRAALFPERSPMTAKYLIAIRRLRRYVRRHGIHTIIVVESTLCLFALPAMLRLGVRVVCWEHFNFGMNGGRRKRTFARHLAALLADDVVTLTERDKRAWGEKTTALARLHSIFNPVNSHPVDFEYDAKSQNVLAVGRLVEQKGFDLLLCVWAQVKCVSTSDTWHLTIVGDGEERARLLNQIAALGLSQSVSLHAATDSIHDYYRTAAVVCCSSRSEGLPMVLIEASQSGIPIVSFDCETGPREIVDHGVSGLLVPDGNIGALAAALVAVMSDEQARMSFSTGAKTAALRFSREHVLGKWMGMLNENMAVTACSAPGEHR
jgi:glycosyltransferase involved in cell wall biosynthesis